MTKNQLDIRRFKLPPVSGAALFVRQPLKITLYPILKPAWTLQILKLCENNQLIILCLQITQRRDCSYGATPELKNLVAGDLFGDFYGLSVAGSASGNNSLTSNSFVRAAASTYKPTARQVQLHFKF